MCQDSLWKHRKHYLYVNQTHVDTVNEINRIARDQCASCFSASYVLITKLSQYFAH